MYSKTISKTSRMSSSLVLTTIYFSHHMAILNMLCTRGYKLVTICWCKFVHGISQCN